MQRFRMKQCAFIVSLTGLLCLFTPGAAHAGAPQWRQARAAAPAHGALRRHTPPKQDQVRRGGLDGSITLIQFISTRRPHDQRRNDRLVPQDSVAQVRASWDDAERDSSATLTARTVQSLPAHWGATHLSV